MPLKLSPIGYSLAGMIVGAMLGPVLIAAAEDQKLPQATLENLRHFTDVFAAMKQAYIEPLEDKQLIRECLKGMASGVDPDSAYLDEEAYAELTAATMHPAGLGLELGIEGGFVKVVSPIDGTPAAAAGLRPGDLLLSVDGAPMKGVTLAESVRRLRGRANTQVTLEIARRGEKQPLVMTLTREVIRVESVKSKLIEPGYAYVRLAQFQERTGTSMARQMNPLFAGGNIRGLVLDLRNNPGGLLDGAINVAAAFLPPAASIATTDGRAAEAKRSYRAPEGDCTRSNCQFLKDIPVQARTVPLVILVNGGSAAGSEIIAGALQDNKRAIVMGSRTFGRASIQTIIPLAGPTGLKLTTARWTTPSGRSVQGKGIVPDIAGSAVPVEPVQFAANDDALLMQALAVLKSKP